MDISKRRSEFSVAVVERTPASAKSLADAVRAVGYEDLKFFPTFESALAAASEAPPHIMVVEHVVQDSLTEQFLMNVRALSDEILVVLVCSGSTALQGFQWVSRHLAYDLIVKPFVTQLELIQKLDRAAGRLYFQFETEQIKEFYQTKQGPVAKETAQVSPPIMPTVAGLAPEGMVKPGFADLNATLKALGEERDLEETVLIFIEALTRVLYDVPVLYFKYFAGHSALLFARATLIPNEKFRGIGVDLKKASSDSLQKYFQNPEQIPELRALVKELFKRDTFSAFTHTNDEEIKGVFVVLDDAVVDSEESKVLALRRAFDIAFQRNLLLKDKHTFDVYDTVTGIFHRRHFSKVIADEVSRARRLKMPVTLLIVGIDDIGAISSRVGIQAADAILKSVVQVFKRSSRVNDVLARVGIGDFACLLPHTEAMGGAIKAERLRRQIESMKFPALDGVRGLTVSCGISEYPTYSGDAESLLSSADDALREVQRAGGNKVCLAQAPAGFQKDFEPIMPLKFDQEGETS